MASKRPRQERDLDPRTRKLLDRLKKERQKRDMSQADVAELANVEVSYVGLCERRQRTPSLDVLLRLADAVGVKPAELFAEAAPARPRDLPEADQLRALLARWPKQDRRVLLRIARDIDRLRRRKA